MPSVGLRVEFGVVVHDGEVGPQVGLLVLVVVGIDVEPVVDSHSF